MTGWHHRWKTTTVLAADRTSLLEALTDLGYRDINDLHTFAMVQKPDAARNWDTGRCHLFSGKQTPVRSYVRRPIPTVIRAIIIFLQFFFRHKLWQVYIS